MNEQQDIPHDSGASPIRLGVAGWNVRREHAGSFSEIGSHLERYATQFNAVEINSCFYRPHRFTTYQRWAATVPPDFRFAVKLPKVITHEQRFLDIVAPLERFLGEVSGLGSRLGPVLIQLPPSFTFDELLARSFFDELRARFDGDAVLEPRHETWFTTATEQLLTEYRIARVAADPARVPAAAQPGGFNRIMYLRLHGSPRIYYSAYSPAYLEEVGRLLDASASRDISTWCIFDNTALGAATADALTVKSLLLNSRRVTR
ncbi:MAG TPA: DUF72 domain-containing protein [Gemmatimonadaceae bacterium]|nr:DUF72 domain-containing protein [Gemmatimonadaceae bacterium]